MPCFGLSTHGSLLQKKEEIIMAILCQLMNEAAVNYYKIEKEIIKIGRAVENDVHIEDSSVSSEHAVIEAVNKGNQPEKDDEKEYDIKDLNSTNGTFVNGEKIDTIRLKNDDSIRIGFTTFKFVSQNEQGITDTVKIKKSWIPGVYYTS